MAQTKQVPIVAGAHELWFAIHTDTLQEAIDKAWEIPGGHIHDEGTVSDPSYYVEGRVDPAY